MVKRVLSAVKREPSNNCDVSPMGSSNKSRGLQGKPCGALSPSDESAPGKSKDITSCVTKRNEDRMIQLLKNTSLSPSERKVRFQGKFSVMAMAESRRSFDT